jgi:hypothetical protein
VYAPNKREEVNIVGYKDLSIMWRENENFIDVVNDTTINLVTNFRFSPEKCNLSTNYKVINRFSTDTMKWQNKNFFPDKYQNFHGCPLIVQRELVASDISVRWFFEIVAQVLNYRCVQLDVVTPVYHDVLESFEYQDFDNYVSNGFVYSSAVSVDYYTLTVPAGEPLYTARENVFDLR